MSRLGHALAVLMVTISCFAPIFLFVPSPAKAYTPHDPISINSDADFAAQAASEGWPGDGSEGNPFIIQDLEIDASSQHGIGISFTTAHFAIRNCLIRDGDIKFSGFDY